VELKSTAILKWAVAKNFIGSVADKTKNLYIEVQPSTACCNCFSEEF